MKHGWEKIPNWECLFVHREKGLFLSVYVDEITLAGKKHNIDPMWKVLPPLLDVCPDVGRTEQMIVEMDKLANEDHTYKANKEEIEFYRDNWWIHTNVVHFDSIPTRYEPEFKSALSTMQRLKRAEDNKKQEATAQTSSSSSSWHWHASWWESDFEYSPQRWYDR